jgi:hypothetical protein
MVEVNQRTWRIDSVAERVPARFFRRSRETNSQRQGGAFSRAILKTLCHQNRISLGELPNQKHFPQAFNLEVPTATENQTTIFSGTDVQVGSAGYSLQ